MGIQINGTNDTITTNDGTISIDGGTTITGSLTGTTGIFSGDVGVAGTLTSEDKTNIDSVGLITARTGIKVGPITGVAATHYSDGSIRTSGIITATTFSGALTGNVTGTASNASGATGDFSIADKIVHTGDTNTAIRFPSADVITAETSGTERFRITSAGKVGINTDAPGSTLHVDNLDGNGQYFITGGSSKNVDIFQVYESSNGDGNHGMVYLRDGGGNVDVKLSTNGNSWFNGGKLLVGATSHNVIHNNNGNSAGDSTTPLLYAEGTGDSKSLTIVSNNTNAWRGSVLGLARTRGSAVGDNTVLVANDNVGQIVFAAADGTDIRSNCASIRADIDGTPGANDVPGRIVFATTADGGVNPTERMRIDSLGRVGINKFTHADTASGLTVQNGASGSEHTFLDIVCNDNETSRLYFSEDSNTGSGSIRYSYTSDNNYMSFYTNGTGATAERLRISSSGRIYIGQNEIPTPLDGNSHIAIHTQYGASGCGIEIKHTGNPAAGRDFIRFYNKTDGEAGSIEHNSANVTAFETSSDYRLKENITDITDGIERLKLLKPRRFSWIEDPELGLRDGFIAHEVTPAIPHCVSGEKDAVKENGKMKPQRMEYSQLTPLLTAALQEAMAKIETLETKVAALESA